MLAVDTNMTVRIVTNDDPEQARRAVALFEREGIFIAKTVLLLQEERTGTRTDRRTGATRTR